MLRLLTIIALWLSAAPALALDRQDVRTLIRAGDVASLERMFNEHKATFDAGTIAPGDFTAPFSEFETTHPAVDETTQLWLARYPDSAHAMAARASFLSHTGVLIRGDGLASTTPQAAFDAMGARLSEAAELQLAALDKEPNHIVAAHGLVTVAAFLGHREWRTLGFISFSAHADPLRAFKLHLTYALPQWGGGGEAILSVCESWQDRLAEAGFPITIDQCFAYAIYLLGQWDEEVAALLSELPEGFDPRLEINALMRARRIEDALALAEDYGVTNRDDVLARASLEDDYSIYDDWLDRALAFSPLNPDVLQWKSYQLRSANRLDEAWPLLDRASTYGRYDPRLWQDLIHWAPQDDRRRVAEEAIAVTEGHPDVLALIVQHSTFTEAAEHFGMDEAEFSCWRYTVALEHQRVCRSLPRHRGCQSAWSIARDGILLEAKAEGLCGAVAPSWQDRVREMLDLNEE